MPLDRGGLEGGGSVEKVESKSLKLIAKLKLKYWNYIKYPKERWSTLKTTEMLQL